MQGKADCLRTFFCLPTISSLDFQQHISCVSGKSHFNTPMKLSSCQVIGVLLLAGTKPSASFSANTCPNNDRSQLTSRKDFLQKASVAFGVAAIPSSPAWAAEDIELPTKEVVATAFDSIRFELADPSGGVAIMQQRIDEKDFPGLMEFTRTYDLELRKLRMGRAKKLLQSKEIKEEATAYANAVTFDLIGMNRNSRKGQENVDGVNKYLQELRDDIKKFLSLETSIVTEG